MMTPVSPLPPFMVAGGTWGGREVTLRAARVHRAARAARRTHPPHTSTHVRVNMRAIVNMLFAQVACNGSCVSLETNTQLHTPAWLN